MKTYLKNHIWNKSRNLFFEKLKIIKIIALSHYCLKKFITGESGEAQIHLYFFSNLIFVPK